ncbi:MAG TPA: YdcF family protein [Aliidongia sp.]|uniref:YdcF family protein n=1 Tax=Aliidongia sp. TaxID=1914230 RepID=UPI002DDDB034|nr:YdcF family protein [Aliidongia sp.]HEV2677640.1 YdcF family protein [Aliidongia sp.]
MRRLIRRLLRSLAQAIGAVVLLTAIWAGGLAWFAAGIDTPIEDATSPTDAIVVLTGGSQRIDEGFRLLVDGKAKKLFVSGVHEGVDMSEVLKTSPQTPHWVECCVVLGHSADSTAGNALETADWLRAEHYSSIRLVTAGYHMRRSLLEFRRLLPPDITIIPHPVFPEAVAPGRFWFSRAGAGVIVVEYVKYLGALVRPYFVPKPTVSSSP